MARIQDSAGRKDENSGYVRLLGNARLGLLVSRLHATVIRTGNELERLLESETPLPRKITLSDALAMAKDRKATGVRVVFSPQIAKTTTGHGIRGDILVFDFTNRNLKVIEVKDGDTFDTKKASGELESLQAFAVRLSKKTGYSSSIHFCSFNQDNKDSIVAGAKGRFSPERVMTGKELCDILGLHYESFRAARRGEQAANLDYFLDELVSNPEVAERLSRKLR